jgi:catecholate siderophore receptor
MPSLPVAVILAVTTVLSSSDDQNSRISGSLVRGHTADATGLALPGARVVATCDGRGNAPETTTDAQGDFVLALEPDTCTVVVMLEGFQHARRRIVVTGAGSDPVDPVEFVLQVAPLTDSVTVHGDAPGLAAAITSATRTPTPLRDVPQSVTIVPQQLMKEQMMTSMADVVRYVPGVTSHQGENNRDQVVIRGNSSSADFFVNGVRDDVQYFRDLYNLERIEALKGPNAMVFGRGGAGGVINRVPKEAGFAPRQEIAVQAGSFDNRRATADVNAPLGSHAALRVNAMFEDSDSFREFVNLHRYAATPTVTFVPDTRTRITLRYEYLHDQRVADRGITSFNGRPADVDIGTYYGNPADSFVNADVHISSAGFERTFSNATLRNQTVFAHYDRGYQNYVPGAADAAGTQVALSAYNNATTRTNVFNQTDLTSVVRTGSLRHTLLAGTEFGHQSTNNFRNTGYFGNRAASVLVPFTQPTLTVPLTFRQSATDADNHVLAGVAAFYGQDQIELSRYLQVIAGLRFDRFDLDYHNNRTDETLTRPDNLVSPRAGLIVKPTAAVSVYASYAVSFLPSSGDQFSSLTAVTEQLKPEKFSNYESGVKWDMNPKLALTSAVYRLDRTNTRSVDPNDPTRIVQTGSTRTNGIELELSGSLSDHWRIVGGYAWQDAFVTRATAAARAGARVAQVPGHMLSLWNHYQFARRVGGGFGVSYRTDMFAAIDNTVVLPGYVRADAAAFVALMSKLRLQANIDNLLDGRYYVNADSNTNISPGPPRTVRVGLTAVF